MDTINIVIACYFGTELGQIIARLWLFGIHITLVANLTNQRWKFLSELLAASTIPFTHRDGHNPCVALHSTLMALVNAELQWVVAGCSARMASDASVPRFDVGRENRGSAHSGLDEYGIDTSLLQLVENRYQLSLLGSCRVGVRPVDSPDGGKPYGSYFMFRRARFGT